MGRIFYIRAPILQGTVKLAINFQSAVIIDIFKPDRYDPI